MYCLQCGNRLFTSAFITNSSRRDVFGRKNEHFFSIFKDSHVGMDYVQLRKLVISQLDASIKNNSRVQAFHHDLM